MFEKRKQKRLVRQYQEFMVRATSVANTLLNMSMQNSPDFDSAARYIWDNHKDVVPTAFAIWYDIAVNLCGKTSAEAAVSHVTSNIAGAPLREPSSRAVICDMLYGMQDRSPNKSTTAWATVAAQQDGWPVAWEVMTLMSSMFGNMFANAVRE